MLALIAGELVPYWDQSEVSSFVAGELTNYQTSSQVSSAISSALSSYDNSSQVDNKIITALLDFHTRAETDQAIANAVSGSSAYYTSAQTDAEIADAIAGLAGVYVRWTELGPDHERDQHRPDGLRHLGGGRRKNLRLPGPATSCGLRARSRVRSSIWCRSSSRPAS